MWVALDVHTFVQKDERKVNCTLFLIESEEGIFGFLDPLHPRVSNDERRSKSCPPNDSPQYEEYQYLPGRLVRGGQLLESVG